MITFITIIVFIVIAVKTLEFLLYTVGGVLTYQAKREMEEEYNAKRLKETTENVDKN